MLKNVRFYPQFLNKKHKSTVYDKSSRLVFIDILDRNEDTRLTIGLSQVIILRAQTIKMFYIHDPFRYLHVRQKAPKFAYMGIFVC